jgi:hypothetical protein
MGPPCAKTSLQSPKNLMTVCHLVCKKRETKNNKCSILPFVPLAPHSNGLSPTKTTPPQNYLINHHHQHYPPPIPKHASPTSRLVSSFLQNHQLHPQQWRRLGRILHQDSPYHKGGQENSQPVQNTIKTQNCRRQRTPCSRTTPTRKSTPLCALPHSPC